MNGREDSIEWGPAQARDFANAFGHNDEPAWVVEHGSLRFVDANAAACALAGYSRDQLLRLRIHDLATPEFCDHLPALHTAFVTAGRAYGEYELITATGARVRVIMRSRANFLPGYHLVRFRPAHASAKTPDATRPQARPAKDDPGQRPGDEPTARAPAGSRPSARRVAA